MSERRATHLAGIDEAGLGPMLGPFALGFSVFRAPSDLEDLRRRLTPAVAESPKPRDGRLAVADSKQVYDRTPRGLARLETTVLAFLAQLADPAAPPRSSAALLAASPTDLRSDAGELQRHPWYAELPETLPIAAELDAVQEQASRLADVLARQELSLAAAGVRLVPAGALNASFERSGSKGLTVWAETERVLAALWERFGEAGIEVWVDRQGARKRHSSLLAQALLGASVRTLEETSTCSAYRIEHGPRWMEVRFQVRAEDRSLPTALASCLAKYGRELSMGAFNRWFGGLQDDLKPTAGYVTDARRWLLEAEPALERAGLARELVVRSR